jgi:hypothetical protein
LREPPLVTRALALEQELGFTHSSIPEVGRLLHLLAAQRGRTCVGELGTGCGTGVAWIVSALPPTVPFVTVELDETLARASADLFAADKNCIRALLWPTSSQTHSLRKSPDDSQPFTTCVGTTLGFDRRGDPSVRFRKHAQDAGATLPQRSKEKAR